MADVYLAEYVAKGDLANKIIRFWTGSKVSHTEWIHDGWMYSSSVRDGGVRRRPCLMPGQTDWHSRTAKAAGEEVVLLDESHWILTWCPWADGEKVLDHFEATEDHPYGWIDLIRSQILRRPSPDGRGDFCNEWCALAQGLSNPRDFSPGGFGDLCRDLNRIWELARLPPWQPAETTKPPSGGFSFVG